MLKLTAVLAFTIVDTGMAVYNKHMYADNNTVGYTAHIAGAVAGLVVGFFALENRSATVHRPTYISHQIQRAHLISPAHDNSSVHELLPMVVTNDEWLMVGHRRQWGMATRTKIGLNWQSLEDHVFLQ